MPVFYGNQLLDDDQIYLKLTDTTPLNSATFSGVQGQSVFAFDYVRGLIDVKLNGKRLKRSAYTATNGTSVTLATPIASNYDVLTIDGFIIEGSQNAAGNFLSYGGTANAITLTSNNAQPAKSYKDGAQYKFRATASNTGAATISVDGLPAKACKTITGAALASGHIRTDMQSVATYYATGDSFVVVSDVGALADTNNAGAVTLSTQAQAIAGTPGVIPDAEQVRKNHVAQVATIADLRALEPAFDGQQCELLGHTVKGLGGGTFYADYSSVAADDNGVTIVTTGGTRWVRKLDGFVSPDMFGAARDGLTNDSNSLIAAVETGLPVSISGEYKLSLNASQSVIFLENIDAVLFMVQTTVNLPSGIITPTKRILLSNPTFSNLILTGADDGSVTATGIAGVSGVSKNHAVTLYIPDTSLFTVGSFALVSGTTGTGYHQVLRGCWEVLSKTASTVVIKSTIDTTWPALTVTSATIWPLNTVIRWPSGTIGMAITTTVYTIQNLVLDGNWDITTGSPSDGAVDGLQVGSSPNTPESGLNESQQTNVGSVYLARVGVVKWENNAIQVFGKMYGVLISACSCGWRGVQASRTGFIGAKGSSSSGNGASGYEAEEGGYILATSSTSAGNQQQGYFAIGSGSIGCGSSFALANGTHGIESKNFSAITADGVTSELNSLDGVTTTAGQVLIGVGAVVSNNTSIDVRILEGGTVNASGASLIGSVDSDIDSNCLYITPAGDVDLPFSTMLENSSGGKVRLDISSIGDLNLGFDPSNTGVITGRIRIKNSGIIHPVVDGVGALGRATEYFSHIYVSNIITKSPDGTAWTINVDNTGNITVV